MLYRDHHPQYHEASARSTMSVSTDDKNLQRKLPIVSTANKNNVKTAENRRVNKSGEMVAGVKAKEPRIGNV